MNDIPVGKADGVDGIPTSISKLSFTFMASSLIDSCIYFISSCLEKLITKKERQMKLTRFIFSRRFEVIVTPLSSDKYLQVLEFK